MSDQEQKETKRMLDEIAQKTLALAMGLVNRSFWSGVFMAVLVMAFWQCLWGAEGYARYLLEQAPLWPPAWAFVPFMAFAIRGLLRERKRAQMMTDNVLVPLVRWVEERLEEKDS